MSRVLLIDPPWHIFLNRNTETVSIGLAYIAAFLRANGHQCLIYNGEFGFRSLVEPQIKVIYDSDFCDYKERLYSSNPLWEETWRRAKNILDDFNPEIVGITIPTAKYEIAVRLAKKIKQSYSRIKIIVGGPHPTLLPQEIIQEDCIDIVVRGEGEETTLELVEALEGKRSLAEVRGITYKRNKEIVDNPSRENIDNLDKLPFPAWDLVINFRAHFSDALGGIFTSRACPYNCIYCASKKIWGKKVRYRSVSNVLDEIEDTHRKFKVRVFRFNDDAFNSDENRISLICDGIIKRKLKIKWLCDCRTDFISERTLRFMKKAGCLQINFGIESGNPKILRKIKKDVAIQQTKRTFALAKKVKLKTLAYFMFGFPGESIEEIRDTIRLMKELRVDYSCWSIVTPYPGTELYEMLKEKGKLPEFFDWSDFFHHSPVMKSFIDLTKEELAQVMDEIERSIKEVKRQNATLNQTFKNITAQYLKKIHLLRPLLHLKDKMTWSI